MIGFFALGFLLAHRHYSRIDAERAEREHREQMARIEPMVRSFVNENAFAVYAEPR